MFTGVVPMAKGLAPAGISAVLPIRTAKRPYRYSALGGFTGTVKIEHSPDGGTTWISLGTITSGADLIVDAPISCCRVNGTHTVTNADVYFIEG